MPRVWVDVDLCDFDDEDLQEELESRGFVVSKTAISGEFSTDPRVLYDKWRLRGDAVIDQVIDFMVQAAGRIA